MRKTIITLVVALASLVPGGTFGDGMPASPGKPAESQASAATDKVSQSDIQPDAPDQYTVVKGDTLWDIADRIYGDGSKYQTIYRANRDVIPRPGRLRPGQVLEIPLVYD